MLAACGEIIPLVVGTAPAASPSGAPAAAPAAPAPAPAAEAPAGAPATVAPRDLPVSTADASRFLGKSTFGSTQAEIDRVMQVGYSNRIDEQFTKPSRSHLANIAELTATLTETSNEISANYTREIMQLFTIGLYELNPDGTVKLDPTDGLPMETYGVADIQGLAKVFTGFSWGGPDTSSARFINRLVGISDREILPMQGYPQFHETGPKSFLGRTINTSAPQDSLKQALDILFNHPNVGPFFGRLMIQRLVTSNPSPAYVGRVAAAFANDGKGVRGDMKAVIRAVLLDPEASRPAGGLEERQRPAPRADPADDHADACARGELHQQGVPHPQQQHRQPGDLARTGADAGAVGLQLLSRGLRAAELRALEVPACRERRAGRSRAGDHQRGLGRRLAGCGEGRDRQRLRKRQRREAELRAAGRAGPRPVGPRRPPDPPDGPGQPDSDRPSSAAPSAATAMGPTTAGARITW